MSTMLNILKLSSRAHLLMRDRTQTVTVIVAAGIIVFACPILSS